MRDGQWAGQGQGRLCRGEVSGVGTEEQPSMGKAGTRGQQQGLPGLEVRDEDAGWPAQCSS